MLREEKLVEKEMRGFGRSYFSKKKKDLGVNRFIL
jgi:hypothetical protein